MVGTGSISYVKDQLENWGWRAVPKVCSEFLYKFPDRSADSVWDRDWELLVVLDSCRVDWMERVAAEYNWIADIESRWSVGGHSEEWLAETFTNGPRDKISETAYVSANPFTQNVADEPFASLDDVTRVAYEGEFPTPPAHVVTDRAIDLARRERPRRLIVHYMQPHKPFFRRTGTRRELSMIEWSTGEQLYHQYFEGNISISELQKGYLDNLRYVLPEVELLLENVDADRAVITADHGHALGEHFLWDHRQGVQHPVIRRVPWVETTAADEQTVNPPQYETDDQNESEVEDRLEALGYR